MAGVQLRGIAKRYDDVEVLQRVDLEILDGEFIVLVGPSGCGKSTLLRCIAGLETVTEGTLSIGERRVNDLPPRDRDVAMVFQSYALYPHMTVARNMGFALELQKRPAEEIAATVGETARLLELTDLLERTPKELSGGQRQRVAIGRAIVRRPSVFLFDEPLSNLDASLRGHMRVELKRLHRTLGATMIYVTHDQVEAMTLADRLVVLNEGIVQQVGNPMEVHDHPTNRFVAGFIGAPAMNFLERADATHVLGIRPHHITLGSGQYTATVDVIEPLGAETLVHLRHNGERLICKTDGTVPSGEVQISFDQVHRFDRVTGDAVDT
jgi:ABC-type sugar transport system ATPase subunit